MKYAIRERDSDAQVAAIIETIACRAHVRPPQFFNPTALFVRLVYHESGKMDDRRPDRRTPPIDYYILPSLIAVHEGFVGVQNFA